MYNTLPIFRTILQDPKAAPVYQYMYSHVGSYTTVDYFLLKHWQKYLKLMTRYFGFDIFNHQLGVSHADELLLMFSNIQLPHQGNCSHEDKTTSDMILKYWTNFAR
jgi:carboxylesterase type B